MRVSTLYLIAVLLALGWWGWVDVVASTPRRAGLGDGARRYDKAEYMPGPTVWRRCMHPP